jgi:hypothetical protein
MGIDGVIRLSNIELTRSEVERLLGVTLDRFEPSKHGASHYGQLNAQAEDWQALVALMNQVGPPIRDCVRRGEMAKPEVDVGWHIDANNLASSLHVPPAVTSAIAHFGFELVASAYLTE